MDVMIHQLAERETELMQANREELVERIGRAMRADGTIHPLPGLHLSRSSLPFKPLHSVLEPSLCVIAQGSKEILLGESRYCSDPFHYLLTTIDLPYTGQVLEARYESRITASPMDRLVAEWLAERARSIGSLIGLTDAQFNSETAAGQWTYRVVAKHVLTLEQDSLKTIAADRAARASTTSSGQSS